jgi:uncharacterized protein YecE (DUF72 family)
MKKYLIGTGGWAYFKIPKLKPLVAYSRVFNFVEVNSTFYEIPNISDVQKWRKLVPTDFEFSVRAHRSITHTRRLSPEKNVLETFEKMKKICSALKAGILHLQTPPSLKITNEKVEQIKQTLASLSLGSLRLALEIRPNSISRGLPSNLQKLMQDNNMVHSVDLSKGEKPAYETDILYTRLFGKGIHNIYQPTDEELVEIDRKAATSKSQKIVMSFHYVKMYKDAARMKIYKQTRKFPSVTNSTGIASLEEVLREDAKFPATKKQLVQSQGWKLFDLDRTQRLTAADCLGKLPEGTYNSLGDVIEKMEHILE